MNDLTFSQTREAVAHRRYAESIETLRKLERELAAAFAEERDAADELSKDAISVDVALKPMMDAARREWRSESGVVDSDPHRDAPVGELDRHGLLVELRRAES